MKTQIIQLNKNDDIVSVREKLGWSQASRVLFILPGKIKYLYTKLELNLIKRHAANLGTQVGMVTKNAEVRYYCHQVGIPVFSNQHNALNSSWEAGRQQEDFRSAPKSRLELDRLRDLAHPRSAYWMDHPITRFISFSLGVFSLLAIGAFLLPSATVSLTPRAEIQSISLEVQADPGISTINLSTGSIPTETRYVVVEGSRVQSASGKAVIPDQLAHGAVQIINISDHTIKIPPNTIVSTLGSDPVRFEVSSEQEINIDPGNSVVVSAQAIVPGSSGNLPPGSIVSIEGDSKLETVVRNNYAMHGGTDASVPAPTAGDLRQLQHDLIEQLRGLALDEFETSLTNGDKLIAASIKLIEIKDRSTTPKIGEPGRELSLSMRLQFQCQVVTMDALTRMVQPILDSNPIEGYSPGDGTILLSDLSEPVLGDDGIARWTIQAQRPLKANLPSDGTIGMIKGLSIPQAFEKLEQSLPLAGQPHIKTNPGWWHRLPFLPMRIQLEILDSE